MVAVRVLHDKSTYNQLELPSGRMAQVKRGDVIAGALGHRKALFGYSGHLPERLAPGDTHPPAQPRRRARHLRLGQPRPRAAVLVRGAGHGAALPVPRRAHRRAGAHRRGGLRPAGRSTADTARRAGRADRGARRLVHERGQDGGGVRAGARADARRVCRWTAPRRPASRCAATCWRWRTRARGERRCSPTSAWCRRRRRTPPR